MEKFLEKKSFKMPKSMLQRFLSARNLLNKFKTKTKTKTKSANQSRAQRLQSSYFYRLSPRSNLLNLTTRNPLSKFKMKTKSEKRKSVEKKLETILNLSQCFKEKFGLFCGDKWKCKSFWIFGFSIISKLAMFLIDKFILFDQQTIQS